MQFFLYLLFARDPVSAINETQFKFCSHAFSINCALQAAMKSSNLLNPSAFNLREFAIPFEADAEHVHTQVFPFITIARAG
jgi:hypothetical protein